MTTIVDRGNHNSEKVLIDVLEDADLEDYIVRDTTYTDEKRYPISGFMPTNLPNRILRKGIR